MSLRIRFRFDGKCRMHPRYNPDRDGRPDHKDCSGCESLRVIALYVSIAQKKAEAGEGLVVFRPDTLASSEPSDTAQSPNHDTEQPDN
jgi:hypothetical protein